MIEEMLNNTGSSMNKQDLFNLISSLCQCGELDALKELIRALGKVDIDLNRILELTCKNSDDSVDVVEYLVEELGADVLSNNLALIYASESGNINIVKYLICKGVDVEAYDNQAIKFAALKGHTEVVELLFYYVAKLDGVCECAAIGGDIKTMEFLLSKGVNSMKIMTKH